MTPRTSHRTKILLVDLETFPILMYAWNHYQTDAIRIVQNTSIASWAAKWLGDKKTTTRCLADYKGYKPTSRDDKQLLEELWPFLDEAEIVVAHNGAKFDAKKINYRFLVNGMKLPSPYRVVDTLTEVRRIAAFDSNKLNAVAPLLDIGEKVRTGGADLWFDCLAGDKKAWAHMKKYNAHDVDPLLEGVYLKLRPWMKNHPNVALGYGPGVCPKCGSTQLKREGFSYNKTTAYQRYSCLACGAFSKDNENLINKEDKPFVSV